MDALDAALEGALGLEAHALELGYMQGAASGQASGAADGRRLGFGRGATLGAELARMSGRAAMLSALADMQPQRCPHRVRRVLSEIIALIAQQPPDPLDEAAFEAIDQARAKMRLIDTWLGGSRPPPAEPTLSF
mmetsp:Transcript_10047/g.30841  ORF Transcript_10047/g.30841 Transcript_10047/m.30841 type:complete len:134 (+) Transcript_10047:116-517(+)